MEATTYQEVQGLSRMTVGELRDKYLEVFGEETRSYHKEFSSQANRLANPGSGGG